MTAADIRFSKFPPGGDKPGVVPIGVITLADVIAEIGSPAHHHLVSKATEAYALAGGGDAGKTAAKPFKNALPSFTPSGVFSYRSDGNQKSRSGIVHADYDRLTPAQVAEMKAKAANDPHCVFAFTSPTGGGVKLFFRCEPSRPHAQAWQDMRLHCLSMYGEEPDKGAKALSQACYFSSDHNIYVAAGEVAPLPPVAPAVVEQAAPSAQDHPPLNVEQVRELLRHIPPRPDHDEWIRVIGGVAHSLSESEGIPLLEAWSPEEKAGEYAMKWASALDNVTAGTLFYLARKSGWKPSPAFKLSQATVDKLTRLELRERLHAREFGNGPEPVKPTPRFLVAGIATSTPGNLTSVFAQAKTGKSSLLAAHIAAAIVAETGAMGCDCLGVTAAEPGGRVLLHIDTEQSVYDHYQQIRRALARAGVTERPSWLRSFQLAGCGARELVESVRLLCDDEAAKGGIFAVIIDGIADLTVSVNDEEDCNALVAGLHDLAIRHDCPILCVLHENPAQNTGKQRGHLGSQLERKAETNLRLKREGEVTTVYADKTRGAPIPEKHGPRFQWSDDLGMHVSIESAATKQEDEKTAELRELAEECVADVEAQALTHSAWVARIREVRGVAKSTAERKLKDMQKTGIIRKDPGSKFWRYVSAA